MSECIPWDELAEGYYQGLSAKQGRPAKDARLVIGAVIIKHKLCLSDEETVAQIQENPYLQYFVGLLGYQMEQPFAPSLFVEIRKRMGQGMFEVFHGAIIDALESAKMKRESPPQPPSQPSKGDQPKKPDDDDESPPDSGSATAEEPPKKQGKLILDATVAPQAIRYPTDLSLLNEAREFSEQIIDQLYSKIPLGIGEIGQCKIPKPKKPRTYR